MKKSKAVTLKSVAKAANVSLATAGRAMGDGGNISRPTVEHVREVARKLGYVRNLQGVKLRTGQSFSLVAALRISNDEEIGDAGASGFLAGLHARVAETDYAVSLVPMPDNPDENETSDRMNRLVARGGFDGIILDHTRPNDPRARFLVEKKIPFVSFGRTDRNDHPWFDIDDELAFYEMTSRMIALGCRRIAFIGGPLSYRFIAEQRKGYESALRGAGLAVDPRMIIHTGLDPKSAREAVRTLPVKDFDAVLTATELSFLGARAGARDLGRNPARDLVFGMRSSVDLGAYLDVKIIQAKSSRVLIGKKLADLLIRHLQGEPLEDLQSLETAQIVSIGC